MLSQSVLGNHQLISPNEQNIEIDEYVNFGKWTNQQNLKYAIFLDFHKITLCSRQKKKNFRVFEEMSTFIATRSTVQCRSHHQKLQQRFRHFKKIISAVKGQVGRREYKLQFKKWTNSGQQLICSQPKPQKITQICKQQNQQEINGDGNVQNSLENKNQQMSFIPSILPIFQYQGFPNAFVYTMPNFYQFGPQYF